LASSNVKHNGDNLAKSEDFTGDLKSLNALKEWGAIFVEHATMVLGESEAQKEIETHEKEVLNLSMQG
jgi:hypothetical protein